ncbi:hypothetical protein IWQ60_007090 [Tieghemiomyces parasiticus]|uniref:Uncharacterized protein n=1 Tax=Tieghemiomyces parasiticus TaxID=78921 RepID=A0A9W8A687_9FUNG|nr:hypothetical protein IWQ60_007090 [Tieghemiomyces parasiticus]
MTTTVPSVDSCFRVVSLRTATVALAALYTAVHFAGLFDWTRPHPVAYQAANLLALAISAAGLYGALKAKARPLQVFGIYLWVGAVASVLAYFTAVMVAILPQGRAKFCHMLHDSPGIDFGYKDCLHNFWKAALLAFPLMAIVLAAKIYLTVVAWSYYRQVKADTALLGEGGRGEYTPIVEQEEA